tara:strand:+ start:417 stop:1274 length:858 start_codon:yes stop_codon:yes gene_type:complete
MRIKAQIIPQRTRGNITIVGSYRDKKTDRDLFLLSNGKKVVTSLDEKERVFQHTFEAGYPITFSFDENDFQDKAVIEFWKNHPLVKTEGYTNTNLVGEQFVFEIKEERIKVEYDTLLSKLSCVSQVINMSEKERLDLTFALGSDPRGMSSKEVFLHLIGLTLSGIAIAKRELVSMFLTVRSSERIATIYANKAIQYGLIKKDASVYKIGGKNAGTTIDSVVSFIMADSELFENYIKPEVDKKDADELSAYSELNPMDLPKELLDLLPITSSKDKKKAGKPTTEEE